MIKQENVSSTELYPLEVYPFHPNYTMLVNSVEPDQIVQIRRLFCPFPVHEPFSAGDQTQ